MFVNTLLHFIGTQTYTKPTENSLAAIAVVEVVLD